LAVFGNLIFAAALVQRDVLPLDVLVGLGLFTFYTDFGGALLFLARDADRALLGAQG
jgi:hypothetical protein